MAKQIIRKPSYPLSSYGLVPFNEKSSGYRGLITLPGYVPRDLSPNAISISTPIVKYRPGHDEPLIRLNIPVMSAAMQAVSGQQMAKELARLGGMSAIYCSQPIAEQAEMARTVKRHKGAFIEAEVVSPEDKIEYVAERMRKTGYSKFFVTEGREQHGLFLGIITDNDFDEKTHHGLTVRDRMRPVSQLDVAYDRDIGYDIKEANDRAKQSHHSALPILYDDGRLRDVIFRRDIREHREHKTEMLDGKKRLMVAAAVNTHDYRERVQALADADVDLFVIDTSQGWTEYVEDAALHIQKEYPEIPYIGGNIVSAEGFGFLVEKCGVYAVKAGMGIGSICITPHQIGVARGQDRAIEEVALARDEYLQRTGVYIPIIADGGVRSVRDMLVALALGADAVMLGRFLAGTNESPTEINFNMTPPKKPYWGEGSARAKSWREKRGYNYEFDEGVEAWVDYVGPLELYLNQAMIQLKDGMRKSGTKNIDGLHRYAIVEAISEEEASPSILAEASAK
jgi:IMP dehydrogenase